MSTAKGEAGAARAVREASASGAADDAIAVRARLRLLCARHWRGLLLAATPPLAALLLLLPCPPQMWQWCAFTLAVVATFWVAEVIPLGVTAFLPAVVFPVVGLMPTRVVCDCYINDSVMMFLGSLMLSYSVEQSGLHRRLAFACISLIGCSHRRLLLGICAVTVFFSLWISNTATTTMMIPIVFAVLRVLENEGVLKLFEEDSDGDKVATDITACYFCTITFTATIGGVGTVISTPTNLVFKSLFMSKYPAAPDYLCFPLFSAFAIPMMVAIEIFLYFSMCIMYFGMFRPGSKAAADTAISRAAQDGAKRTIAREWDKLGKVTYWEWMVIVLFGSGIVLFFTRTPQIFPGWGDYIEIYYHVWNNYVKDSAVAMMVLFLMYLFPSKPTIWDTCRARYLEDLPKSPIQSILNWKLVSTTMPFSYMFLLGAGIALSRSADFSGLNHKLGEYMAALEGLPNLLTILLIILFASVVNNFASNVAVCNIIAPIAMTLATKIGRNPLWYVCAAGYTTCFCYMIPVSTPGNLIVQNAAHIPTYKMVKAGAAPSVGTVLLLWVFLALYAPAVWPVMRDGSPWWLNVTEKSGRYEEGAHPSSPVDVLRASHLLYM